MSGLAQGRQIWSGAESATKRAESGTKSRQLKIVITKYIYIYICKYNIRIHFSHVDKLL